ncbi:MAG: cation:proton antiporter regulatory subunit, partial [Bdellovibrionia bacterium]
KTFEGKFSLRPFIRPGSQILALLLMATLSANFFPPKYVFFVSSFALLIAFFFFYRRLERSYQWLERQFLATFESKTPSAQANHDMISHFKHLAPWDAHLVKLEVHPNSPLVMKKIEETALRARFGVNIVAIQRGRVSIVTPKPHEFLLPRDELILLGTDDQVELLRKELENPSGYLANLVPTENYQLRQVQLTEQSPFPGKTIRQSGFREVFHAMVVGIERSDHRQINPDSDFLLQAGDVLWVAGDKTHLDELFKQSHPESDSVH